MSAELSIVTLDDIIAYVEKRLDPDEQQVVRDVIRNDDRAKAAADAVALSLSLWRMRAYQSGDMDQAHSGTSEARGH